MTVVCLTCEGEIERSNYGFAGYCSPECRDRDHVDRAAARKRKHRRPEGIPA